MSIENVVPMWYQLYSAYDGTPTRSVKAAFYPLGSTMEVGDLPLLLAAGYGNTCNYIPWSNFGNRISADLAKVSGVPECREWEWSVDHPQITLSYTSEYAGAFCYTREPNTSNFYFPAVIMTGFNRQVGGSHTNLASATYYQFAGNISSFPLTDFDAPPACVITITEKNNGYGFGTYYVQGTHTRGGGFEYLFTDENKYHQNIIRNIQGMVDRDPNDPYTPDVPGGGSSEPGGGGGTWDFSDDDIPLPTLPTISSLDSGFIAAYSPTLAQLNDLASYMWSTQFITNLVKLFGDSPMDVIMGLSIIPITPPTGTAIHVKLGNLDSNVSMKPITQQFVTVDCGSITLPGIYDAFLDWEPFTKATLYLPYIGAVNLNTNDIMGKTVNVTYYIDVISGACNAMVSAGGSVLYTFNGQCAAQMPITGSDYRSMFQSAIQAAVSLITGTMSGIAGNTSGVVAGISGVAGAATNFHPNVVHSGSVAGTAGMLAVQKPYLIVTVPHICAPARQNYYKGYPGLVTVPLGTLSGFTVVESIHLDLMPGTEEEKREMMELLTGGVIL